MLGRNNTYCLKKNKDKSYSGLIIRNYASMERSETFKVLKEKKVIDQENYNQWNYSSNMKKYFLKKSKNEEIHLEHLFSGKKIKLKNYSDQMKIIKVRNLNLHKECKSVRQRNKGRYNKSLIFLILNGSKRKLLKEIKVTIYWVIIAEQSGKWMTAISEVTGWKYWK